MKSIRHLFAAVAGLILLAVPASAAVIYSSLGPGDTYNCCAGSTISGPTSSPGSNRVAMGFTASGSYDVGQIDVAVGYISGGNGTVVSLWTGTASSPDVMLGLWNVTSLPPFGVSSSALSTISGITGISVTGGAQYFLMVESLFLDGVASWNAGNAGATAHVVFSSGGAGWVHSRDNTAAAFDILSADERAVPEPSTLLLLGAALAGIGAARRRRRA